MKMRIKKLLEYRLFRILLCLTIILLIILGAMYLATHKPGTKELAFPCLINEYTGLYCTGCGMARCLRSILELNFYNAFRYNPLAFILLPIFTIYLILSMISFIVSGKNVINKYINSKIFIVIIVIIALFTILRNIPIYPFTTLVI